MNQFYAILILQVLLALLLAITLCVAVWRLAKAGGSVKVGFIVKVDWGTAGRATSATVAASGGRGGDEE